MSAYSAAILGTSGLLNYWRFDEGSGTSFADLGSSNLTLTANGSVTANNATPIANDAGYAISTSGTAFVENTAPGTGYNSLTQLSLEAWIKYVSGSATQHAIRVDISGSAAHSIRISTQIQFYVTTGASTLVIVSGTTTISDGNWHHLVGTWRGDTGAMVAYVDGVSQKTGTNAGTIATPVAQVRVCGHPSTTAGQQVDEAAVYDRVLTAAEVLYHYNLGKGIIANDQRSRPARTLQSMKRAAVI